MDWKGWAAVITSVMIAAAIIGGLEYRKYGEREAVRVEMAEERRISDLQDGGATPLNSAELRELLNRRGKREADRAGRR